jgi:hypothetical protein
MRLIIYTKSLKDFLNLFDKVDYLEDLSLGDTWHPSDGYVDELILGEQRTVDEILKFPYDFVGLVFFECKINKVFIKLNASIVNPHQTYELSGIDYQLRHLTYRIIELNTETPDKYEYNLTEY